MRRKGRHETICLKEVLKKKFEAAKNMGSSRKTWDGYGFSTVYKEFIGLYYVLMWFNHFLFVISMESIGSN